MSGHRGRHHSGHSGGGYKPHAARERFEPRVSRLPIESKEPKHPMGGGTKHGMH